MRHLTRRTFVGSIAGLGAAATLPAFGQGPTPEPILKRAIPSTGEQIPAIGLGTWITFNVGSNERLRAARAQVMQTFFDRGGSLIDSSPMYGSSEAVIGYGLTRVKNKDRLFSAGKVWTVLKPLGVNQMESSRKLWGVERFDLMQVHNLLDWSTHLETLKTMKAQGRLRYIGITTSQGWRHGDLEKIMRSEPIDFVAFSYNVVDREVEERLLPLAAERGIGVIVNRPFQEGVLIDRMMRHPLPPWADDIDCANWAQFLLKFIISHPAVTCAIPATRRVDHIEENMGAMRGRMPDAKLRARMTRYVETV
jgi:aryl-alcohol dehydrogenase-like predicted oxidoreductase